MSASFYLNYSSLAGYIFKCSTVAWTYENEFIHRDFCAIRKTAFVIKGHFAVHCFFHSSVVTYISFPWQQWTHNETWLPHIIEIIPPQSYRLDPPLLTKEKIFTFHVVKKFCMQARNIFTKDRTQPDPNGPDRLTTLELTAKLTSSTNNEAVNRATANFWSSA